MSFIPSRDVFDMSQEQKDAADDLYDKIEAEWLDHFAEDEFGKGWTFKKVREEPRYRDWYPSFGAYDMMIYMMNRKEWNAKS